MVEEVKELLILLDRCEHKPGLKWLTLDDERRLDELCDNRMLLREIAESYLATHDA